MNELPAVADVKAAIKGDDSAARQEAACGVLEDYVEGFTGHDVITEEKMPALARSRWREYRDAIDEQEYQRTHMRLGNSGVGGPARAYLLKPKFRTEILSQFVSERSLIEYKKNVSTRAAEDREAEQAKANRRADEVEADRRAHLSQEELVEEAREQSDKDAIALIKGVMSVGRAAAAADQAMGGNNTHTTSAGSVPRTGRYDNHDESPFARAQRHTQCVDSCQLRGSACYYGEDPSACSTRQWNERQSCISGCGP